MLLQKNSHLENISASKLLRNFDRGPRRQSFEKGLHSFPHSFGEVYHKP